MYNLTYLDATKTRDFFLTTFTIKCMWINAMIISEKSRLVYWNIHNIWIGEAFNHFGMSYQLRSWLHFVTNHLMFTAFVSGWSLMLRRSVTTSLTLHSGESYGKATPTPTLHLPTPPRFSCVVFSIEDQGTSCRQGQKIRLKIYQKCNLIEIREIILHSILTTMHKCKLTIAGTETLKRVYISAGITVR